MGTAARCGLTRHAHHLKGKKAQQALLQAFLFRKLKIKGSMAKALKVQPVLDAAKAATSKL
jgi:putative sterol carrier protein